MGGIEFYGLVFEFDSFFDEFERQFCIVDNTGMELGDLKIKQDVLRTFEMWDCIPALTPMKPGTRLTKEQSNPSPDPAFHRRYRGIVGSLGYLVIGLVAPRTQKRKLVVGTHG